MVQFGFACNTERYLHPVGAMEPEMDVNEENVIKVLNKADLIIRNSNILDTEYRQKFNEKQEFTDRPDLAMERVDKYLENIEKSAIKAMAKLALGSDIKASTDEDIAGTAALEETFVVPDTPEKSLQDLNSTLQLEHSYLEESGSGDKSVGSPTLDIMLGCDLLKFTQSGRDDSRNEDGNETTVCNTPEKNKSTFASGFTVKSVNKLPEDVVLKTEFDRINLANSCNITPNRSVDLLDPMNQDSDQDMSSLSQLYVEHVAEMSAKKYALGKSNGYGEAHDCLDEDEMSSSMNNLYNSRASIDSNTSKSIEKGLSKHMSVTVSVRKKRHRGQHRLNVKQLGRSPLATTTPPRDIHIVHKTLTENSSQSSPRTPKISAIFESTSMSKHQYSALIWMLLREDRLKLAKRVSKIVFGKSYYEKNFCIDENSDKLKDSYGNLLTNKSSERNTILSFLQGGILADAVGMKKAATVAALLSSTALNGRGKSSIIVTSPARIDLWRHVLSCIPNLKVHFYNKKKSARTHNVSILLDPTDYFTKYDVVVTTYTIVACNEVNSKTAVRKSAWIKRRQKSPMSSKNPENQASYLHLTSYERVIVDQAHTFATTTSKKYIAIRKLRCNFRWCLCDDVPATTRRLSTLLTFLTRGNNNKMSIEQIAAITAAKDICVGSKYPKRHVIMLARQHEKV